MKLSLLFRENSGQIETIKQPKQGAKSCLLVLILGIWWGLFSVYSASAQTIILSPQTKVSLVTVSPGEELYSGFGHSAFWISDPVYGIDRVYNYGTFDFRTEGFYVKFVRGQLPYMLSVSPIYNTLAGAQYEDRSVFEDELNLTQSQKQRLYELLEINLLPENKFYRYDFLFDNCSTRLRDMLVKAVGDSVQFSSKSKNMTYRDWIQYYMNQKPFIKTGMDILLGTPTDKQATAFDEMFLPDNLREEFREAKIRQGATEVPLVTRDTVLFQEEKPIGHDVDYTVLIISFVLLLAGIFQTRSQLLRNQISFRTDRILFFIAGLFGCLMAFLWFGTDHAVTQKNWNLLWAIPFHVVVVFLLRKSSPAWVRTYFAVSAVLAAIALVFSAVTIFQEFNIEFAPVIALLALRAWAIQRQLALSHAKRS
ncbi:Lnb N-terminal periplasmic domain-containing protein [Tellurirhabdus bombi]|uniref:Lnb N-terminal periplasmic domain-containing protein n=1 Tax=Tellurirhabdus bombi TaxID=2907205 RepID=UPI001F1CD6D7|nr:DUF4105 domain-containing protein [Tellurirhabdus bombi]